MQRELGALNLQYYSDPVKAMQQQYTRSDINDKTAQIEAKKKAIEADQQAISDAEDDLRKAGGEPDCASTRALNAAYFSGVKAALKRSRRARITQGPSPAVACAIQHEVAAAFFFFRRHLFSRS